MKAHLKGTRQETEMLESLLERAKKMETTEGTFLGGGEHVYARAGRNQLITLIDQGMTPECRLLDVGCGSLRGGYWTMHYLLPDCYYGLEPEQETVEQGLRHLFDPAVLAYKRPVFRHNDDFDFSVFGVEFDYYIARSIWSHTSQQQIEAMLDSFKLTARKDGAMLVSFIDPGRRPANATNRWVDRFKPADDGRGTVSQDPRWIAQVCADRGLKARRLYRDCGQIWLKVHREGEHQHLIDREPVQGRVLGYTRQKDRTALPGAELR